VLKKERMTIKLFMKLFSPKLWKENLNRLLIEDMDSPYRAASAVAVGIFFGISPFWGFQLFLALIAASFLKLNRIIAGISTNISVPPLIPFIVYSSTKLGDIVLSKILHMDLFFKTNGITKTVSDSILKYIIGSFFLAFICALFAWILSYFVAFILMMKKKDRMNV
jgi:uncharacterized protein (DUF2062 family)